MLFGCYAEVAKEEIEKIDEVDLVLGNHQKANIDRYIESYFEGKELKDEAIDNYFYDFGSITYTEKTRAVIKVQDGCNNFCSYCIIPYARGRICSRKPESVLEEIDKIANKGIKEVVITGIQVSSYGKDFDNNYRLIDLLEEINKIRGIERIRLGSLEPVIITDEFCARIYKIEKLCHHFHLSLQSGCDKTLKEMNRKYTISDFEKVVQRLRNLYEDVILTTDIIVGFPNETEEDFLDTLNVVEECKYDGAFTFIYSKREGTPASKMDDSIPLSIKEERLHRLNEIINSYSNLNNQKYLNTIQKVLLVGKSEKDENKLYGYTETMKLVNVTCDKSLIGTIANVKITEAKSFSLDGVVEN